MQQRQGILNKQYRFFFWAFTASLIMMIIFLGKLFYISYKYSEVMKTIQYAPFTGLLMWFFLIFFLLNEWGNAEFSGFITRLDREIKEVIKGERKNIFFRKKDPWKIENLKKVISNKLEKIRELERDKLIYSEELLYAKKENNREKLKEIGLKLKRILEHS